ncbi:MAG: Hsp20/alpha crystallin family protein [Candidatus Hydrothermarchaeales archaeon]
MSDKEKKEPEKEKEGISIDLGFGELFKGLGNIIDMATKMAEEGKSVVTKTGEIEGLGGKAKGVFGVSVRTLAGGETRVEPFGNIRRMTEKGPVVEEVREPIIDVFEEADYVQVVAELPGVEEKDIKYELKEDKILTITSLNAGKKYCKEVFLSCPVDPEKVESKYKNGILELKLIKRKEQ